MNKDMTYCINDICPFKDCIRHADQIKNTRGIYSFANFDSTCERYIRYLLNEAKIKGVIK